MIKTLLSTNSSTMKVGNLQIQPLSETNQALIETSSSDSTGTSETINPEKQQQNIQVVSKSDATTGEVTVTTSSSLEEITAAVMNGAVVPAFQGDNKHDMHSTHDMPAMKASNSLQSMQTIVSVLESIKKLQPYEQLTGISQERPEIVAMTSFSPLYDDSSSVSDAGEYFLTQVDLRTAKRATMEENVNVLRSRDSAFNNLVHQRVSKFVETVDGVESLISFLFSVMTSLETLKSQLDLRNDLYTIEHADVVSKFVSNFAAASKVDLGIITKFVMPSYKFVDVLEALGFTKAHINKFASTKIWLQLMIELNNILRTHTLQFMSQDPDVYRDDDNATVMVVDTAPRFALNSSVIETNLPTIANVITFSTLPQHLVKQQSGIIQTAYGILYDSAHLSGYSTTGLAIASFALSKEYRYSVGLGRDINVQSTLTQNYGVTIKDTGNTSVFDNIVGISPTNIGDIPTTNNNSLTSLAQRNISQNTGVLMFEEKYIDDAKGTMTPGSAYYIDQTLNVTSDNKFDVSKLTELNNLLNTTNTNFSTIMNGLNTLMLPTSTMSRFEKVLANPVNLLDEVAFKFVSDTGELLGNHSSDRLLALFAAAGEPGDRGLALKSLLFVLAMARSASTFQDLSAEMAASNVAAAVDMAAHEILNLLKATLPTVAVPSTLAQAIVFTTTGQFITVPNVIGHDEIIALLTGGGSSLLGETISLMWNFMNTFGMMSSLGTEASNMLDLYYTFANSKSIYSGCLDTVIMMILFDMIIDIVSAAAMIKFTGTTSEVVATSEAVWTGGLFVSATDPKQSYVSDAREQLQREIGLTQQVVTATLTVLSKLKTSTSNLLNYLTNPDATTNLRSIISKIGDSKLLQMLMSEQQIMMLASMVADLKAQMGENATTAPATRERKPAARTKQKSVAVDREVKFVDGGVIGQNYSDLLLKYFNQSNLIGGSSIDKKIISVGIPLGFTKRLKQHIDLRDQKPQVFVDKQGDVVSVSIYRVDMQNPDVIYKPIKFLFELSRFPVRDESLYSDATDNTAIDRYYYGGFPTRDFSQFFEAGSTTPVQYGTPQVGQSEALAGASYAFLTQGQKDEIVRNHIVSHLLETYVKVMTGMELAEYKFDVDPSDNQFIENEMIRELALRQVNDANTSSPLKVSKALKSTSATKRNVFFSTDATEVLSTPVQQAQSSGRKAVVARDSVALATHNITTISGIAHTLSTMSDPNATSKLLLRPKKFDRVLHVSVDPDDFKIDYATSTSTPHGAATFNNLITEGEISVVTQASMTMQHVAHASLNSTVASTFVAIQDALDNVSFQSRPKNKIEGDTIFDKYFVVIETFGDEVI